MRVGLFVTCLIDLMRPEIGFSVIKLIEGAGFEVVVPPAQTCCGQPAYNSGDRRIARDLAEKTLREFEQFDYVVVPSGSCGGMIRAHYGDLCRDDPELMNRFGRLRGKVFELTDFLVNVAKVPPKPQQCSQSFISVTATPTWASSARGWALTPSSRSPEQESWYVTSPANSRGCNCTLATLTRKSVNSNTLARRRPKRFISSGSLANRSP